MEKGGNNQRVPAPLIPDCLAKQEMESNSQGQGLEKLEEGGAEPTLLRELHVESCMRGRGKLAARPEQAARES